jgi:hypothetical protein
MKKKKNNWYFLTIASFICAKKRIAWCKSKRKKQKIWKYKTVGSCNYSRGGGCFGVQEAVFTRTGWSKKSCSGYIGVLL